MLPLIAIFAMATLALVFWMMLRPKDQTVLRRIGAAEPADASERRLQQPFTRRILAGPASRAGHAIARLLPQNLLRHVNQLRMHAGEPWSLAGFLTVWLLFAATGVALFVFVGARADIAATQKVPLGIGLIAFPALIPYTLLRRRAINRRKRITRSLPDALDLLTTCVEAGMGSDAAFALVTEKTEGPLSAALARYLKEAGLGRSRRAAILEVAEATGVPDFIDVAAAINQSDELGTTLGDVFRHQAEELRALRRQRAQVAAQKAPVLMTIPLALCFIPAMVSVVVVPSILNLVDFVGTLGE